MFYGCYHSIRPHEPIRVTASRPSGQAEILKLEYEVERLLMITEALWDILREQHDYDDAELLRRVTEIDMRDGRLDGKVKRGEAKDCTRCSRKLNRRHIRCIYCGAAHEKDPFER